MVTAHIARVFFACPTENLDNFHNKAWVRSFASRLSLDYADWWRSCYHVLHIERVWSTIVSFCFAFVQNVRWKLRKRFHTFVVFYYRALGLAPKMLRTTQISVLAYGIYFQINRPTSNGENSRRFRTDPLH